MWPLDKNPLRAKWRKEEIPPPKPKEKRRNNHAIEKRL